MAELEKTTITAQLNITPQMFDELETAGEIKLLPDQRLSIERALKRYENLRKAKFVGVGRKVVPILKKLEAAIEKTEKEISELANEPGHLWEYLSYRAGVDHVRERKRLRNLKRSSARIRRLAGKKKRDFYLETALLTLEAIFFAAGGKSTGISRGDKDRHGRFLSFSFAALNHLPKNCRPQSMGALGGRWERILNARKKGEATPFKWVGGPHPFTAHQ